MPAFLKVSTHHNINSKMSSKDHQLKNPKSHLNQDMNVTLGMIYPVTQFFSICRPMKLEKQIICSPNTMVGQAQDRHSIVKERDWKE